MNEPPPHLTPHCLKLYRLFNQRRSLTAKQIAQELHLHPQAVYRLAHRLIRNGLLYQDSLSPLSFQAVNPSLALRNYLSLHRDWLHSRLASAPPRRSDPLQFSFLPDRTIHLNQFITDTHLARQTIKFLIVGLPVPPKIILAQKQALDRGVAFRILVQRPTVGNRLMLRSWLKMGFPIHTCPSLDLHLFLFDDQIAYFGPFDPRNPRRRFLFRFANPAITQALTTIFSRAWANSQSLTA